MIKKIFRKRYPHNADAVYIVRDDDRFFSDFLGEHAWCTDRIVASVKAFDAIFLERGIPVTAAVVPNYEDGRYIDQETGLVEYLKFLQMRDWEIAQHGNTHEVFTSYDKEKQIDELLKGKDTLERLFGKITTFVPPKNFWDEILVDSLSKTGFLFLSADGKERLQMQKIGSIWALHRSFNPVLSYETGTLRDATELNKAFDDTFRKREVFCNMFHSWIYEGKKDKLKQITEHLDYLENNYGKKIWYTTIRGYGETLV
jgi:peptidoglycan/xylan/chitin deacetylase (PgdA/CDA1 family)